MKSFVDSKTSYDDDVQKPYVIIPSDGFIRELLLESLFKNSESLSSHFHRPCCSFTLLVQYSSHDVKHLQQEKTVIFYSSLISVLDYL